MADITHINGLSDSEARTLFLRCCGSARWAAAMTECRPFTTESALFAAAADAFRSLSRADWLESFAAHPRIGDVNALCGKFGSWSAREQAGVVATDEAVLHALEDRNRAYMEKFGHIFIVFATGKSAAEMLALLEERMPNDADKELLIAAGEQEKITRLRLEKI
jgi:2-oxo-4-hydroxy-4-carboxy-5-ureidoimidazoline decarboxylase